MKSGGKDGRASGSRPAATLWPRTLLTAAAVLLLAATAITPFDGLHWLSEQFSHFKLQYLATGLLLALLFLRRGQPILAAVLFAASLVNAAYVVPWHLPGVQPSAEAGAERLRLLMANVYRHNARTQPFLDLVMRETPDLIAMLEVTPRWVEDLDLLSRRFPHRLMELRDDPFGIALLSRRPLLDPAVVRLNQGQPPSLKAGVELGGRRLTLIITHPLPPESHTWWVARNRQLSDLARAVRETEGPLVLLGDLNITMWSSHYRRLEDATGLRNVRRGYGVLPTWPTGCPLAMIPLDHCLISGDLRVDVVRTGPNVGSDHLPLIVWLSLAASGDADRPSAPGDS